MQTINPPKLPRFTGEQDGCEAEDFIKEAIRILTHCDIPDGAAVEWIIQSLEGCARREVINSAEGRIATPRLVLQLIHDTFGEKRDITSLQRALFTRRQGLTEGILEYAQCMQLLAEKVNNIAGGTVTSEALRNCFVDGLYPPSLRRDVRRFVRDHENCTFGQARAEALRWMREDTEVDARAEQVTVSREDNRVKELEAELAALKIKTAEMEAELKLRPPVSAPPRSRPPIVCWWCNKQGHRQADCRAKRREEGRRRDGQQQSQPQQRRHQPQQQRNQPQQEHRQGNY